MSAGLDVALRGTLSPAGPGAGARVRAAARSSALWISGAAAVLLAAIAVFAFAAAGAESRAGHYDSFKPEGAHAFVALLGAHGADVATTQSRDEALALADRPDTTVVVAQPDAMAADDAAELATRVGRRGGDLVLVAPDSGTADFTQAITAGLGGGAGTGAVEPGCGARLAARAGPVTAPQVTYGAAGHQRVDVCYRPAGAQAGYGGLARTQLGRGSLVALGSADWLSNAHLADEGNAALALGAAGGHRSVVYYYAQDESSLGGADDGGTLLGAVPPWFRAALLWLIPVAAALLLWRGRRLGPLAVERLPVVVPPIETVLGRAGLLQRAGARDPALADLRTGALLRLARRLGLPRTARPAEISAAAARASGRDPAAVDRALLHARPVSEAELVALAQTIHSIESEADTP
ncbi:DUF4350 domain-containing protein [Brevibacterium sp. BRM-1]|uniref:DUF4350 domain-containing protein n=1 Tax=Brevibacterium sp. BRM-1 TaxID=2999062 RepID=UPI00227F01B6|nr:DUF4350 domain-containing protein [Brevibacterium sp. BRM-1]WAL40336.1 DUF4350 domain-containing protein [Brevibacterium sp. BRM-1]